MYAPGHVQTPITWADPGHSPRRCGGGLPQHPSHSSITMMANLEADSHQTQTGCTSCVLQCRKTKKKALSLCSTSLFISLLSELFPQQSGKSPVFRGETADRSTDAWGFTRPWDLGRGVSLEPCVEAASNPCGSWGTYFNVWVKS